MDQVVMEHIVDEDPDFFTSKRQDGIVISRRSSRWFTVYPGT
jgi:hypothetical protein